jgi:hypothetical protein
MHSFKARSKTKHTRLPLMHSVLRPYASTPVLHSQDVHRCFVRVVEAAGSAEEADACLATAIACMTAALTADSFTGHLRGLMLGEQDSGGYISNFCFVKCNPAKTLKA